MHKAVTCTVFGIWCAVSGTVALTNWGFLPLLGVAIVNGFVAVALTDRKIL